MDFRPYLLGSASALSTHQVPSVQAINVSPFLGRDPTVLGCLGVWRVPAMGARLFALLHHFIVLRLAVFLSPYCTHTSVNPWAATHMSAQFFVVPAHVFSHTWYMGDI